MYTQAYISTMYLHHTLTHAYAPHTIHMHHTHACTYTTLRFLEVGATLIFGPHNDVNRVWSSHSVSLLF